MLHSRRHVAGLVRALLRPVLEGPLAGPPLAAPLATSSAQAVAAACVPAAAAAAHGGWLSHRHSYASAQQARPFVQVQHEASEPEQQQQQQQQPQGQPAAEQPLAAAAGGRCDPFGLVRDEIEAVSERLRRSIFTDIPSLEQAAEYFFRAGAEGKRMRSTILLLLASSLSAAPLHPSYLTVDESPPAVHPEDPRRRQQRLAEITELIHVASLLHDDVIDNADTRRGLRALNTLFGNKVAILAGDFLLARASVSLASLRNNEVVMLMSQVLENLVAGEILQMTATPEDSASMEHYLRKTYCKTASLIANSCQSIAVLGSMPPDVSRLCWEYGRHLGLAFQVVDDVMDFTCTAAEMGKPALNDLRSGLATAPTLYAAEEHPELLPLIQRRFKQEGDVERAQQLVERSRGIQRSRELALHHAQQAAACIQQLPPALSAEAESCRQGLLDLTQKVLNRKK